MDAIPKSKSFRKMFLRGLTRFSSDFAHKQVSSGFSKKYGENYDRIFGKSIGGKRDLAKDSLKEAGKTKEKNSK